MKKVLFHKYLLLMVLLMQGLSLFAQKEANIWYFGNYAGLNFNTNPPTALTNSVMSTYEGSSSIADKNGNLLFYTDGITVWNKNHQIMTNGTGLLGHPSSSHSALIIKHPDLDSVYIIFTTSNFGSSDGACYSIVNMKLSAQLGTVTTKNIKLVNVSAEKIAAINHANLRDIWIAIPAYGTDSIYTFLVTPSGINLNAVKNRTGSVLKGTNYGQIKFSNNALKLAFINTADSTLGVSDFNNSTGVISNTRFIYGFTNLYGLEISPNSQYLYISEEWSKKLSQCYIPSLSTNRSIVCGTIDSNTLKPYGQLQLGPDKKIYSALFGSGYIGVIHEPNNHYSKCDYIRDAIYLNGKNNIFGLPTFFQSFFSEIGVVTSDTVCFGDSTSISFKFNSNFLDSINWYIGDTITPIIHGSKIKQFKYLSKDTSTKVILAKVFYSNIGQSYYGSLNIKRSPLFDLGSDAYICFGDSIILKATYPGASYVWQDAKTDSIYTVKTTGLYKATSTLKGCFIKDSIRIRVINYQNLNIGSDTSICVGDSIKLRATFVGAKYLWQNNTTDSTYLVKNSGLYWVQSNYNGCIKYDSVKITIRPKLSKLLINDTIICGATNFQIIPNYSFTYNYLWSDNSTDSVLNIDKNGKYWVIVNDSGCVNKDTVSIVLKAFPTINLGNDTMICENKILLLKAKYLNANYLWSDGSKDSIFEVKKAGKYWLSVNDSSCISTDTIELRYKKTPTVNLGNDTILCDNAILLLKVPFHYQSYLWNDLSKGDSLLVSKEGLYSVTVNDSGCIAQDEIQVSYLKTPIINLGNDTSFCGGVPFYLKATNPKTNYLWSNFSTDSIIKLSQSGTYWVKVYNACGTSFDTTEIKIEACNCYFYFPNAFTPNGNGLNEVFLPVSNCKITNYQLIILNRWGDKIFESNNPNIGWNGKFNEILQSNEVYVYQLEADLIDNFIGTNKKRVTLNGNVTLLN